MSVGSMSRKPMRIAQYFGGKGGTIAKWIVQNLPAHSVYVEPFGGLASVLLNKPKCDREIYGELNRAALNIVMCLKTDARRLIDEIKSAIVFSEIKEMMMLPVQPKNIPDFDAASHFYLHCEMSFMGGGLRWSSGLSPSAKLPNPDHLFEVAERLKDVEVREQDAIELICSAPIDPEILLYVDPPYLHGARKSKDCRVKNATKSAPRRQYLHELSECKHITLRNALEGRSAVVSGYNSELYQELYQGWEVRSLRYAGDVEHLWISPQAIALMPQLSLFSVV